MTEDISSAILSSWSVPFWPTLFLLLLSLVYIRGWRRASSDRPAELPFWRLISFHVGLLILWLAITSPLDALGEFLLVAHMTQHLLLMSVVPPLLWLGAPIVPLLRGVPRVWMSEVVATWIDFRPFQAIGRVLAHPLFAWLAMNAAYAIWHIPAMYELALRSNEWHYAEHACFLFGSMAYWWHVVQPWPAKATWSRWLILPYIVGADIVNTAISASLAFSGSVLYATYALAPRIFDLSALDDQVVAGAEMWVIGSMISLVPLMAAVRQLLSRATKHTAHSPAAATPRQKRLNKPFNLLAVPVIGTLLRWRYGRLLLQFCSFTLLLVIVVHGLSGTRLSALNLAGGAVWMTLRPLLFLLILCIANVFCMACPFTFPRELARIVLKPTRHWPRVLRNKWVAITLIVAFFWCYLQYDLWNWPSATAVLLIAYTAAALLIDSLFEGASFCKYVCPVGQFNFVTSLVAPLSIKVQSQSVCTQCAGSDCVQGNAQQRGCELQLYLPQKIGNMDCTLCMDCVKACPHDNVQWAVQSPVLELVEDPLRSSVRRFSQRMDLAALLLVFVLFSVWNAAAMTAPVLTWTSNLKQHFPLFRPEPILALCYLAGVFIIIGATVAFSKGLQLTAGSEQLKAVFCRLSLCLLPMGLATWAAHLLFHFTTANGNLLPVADQFLSDFKLGGLHLANALQASAMPTLCSPGMVMLASGGGGTNLMSLQIWILDAGMLAALYLLWWSFAKVTGTLTRRIAVWLSAAAYVALYYAAAVWIFTQPMLMTGAGQ